MKLLLDFIPIITFFIIYTYTQDILLATVSLFPLTLLQIFITWWLTRKVERMHLITFTILLIMGGLTLIFRNPLFIQWKPTVAYALLALIFWINLKFSKNPILQRLLGNKLTLAPIHWRQLTWSWIGFFVICGILNILVVYYFNINVWVHYKLYGQLILTLLFLLVQGIYLHRNLNKIALIKT